MSELGDHLSKWPQKAKFIRISLTMRPETLKSNAKTHKNTIKNTTRGVTLPKLHKSQRFTSGKRVISSDLTTL